MHKGYTALAVVTGKPLAIGGSEAATSDRAVRSTRSSSRQHLGHRLEGAGGRAGLRNAARSLRSSWPRVGAKIVGVSDTSGGIHSAKGFDPLKVDAYKRETGSVTGFPGTRGLQRELLELDCDILIPAASRTRSASTTAPRIRRRSGRGRERPDQSRGGPHPLQQGVFLIPDILCNAGASPFRTSSGCRPAEPVLARGDDQARLKEVMVKSFNDVLEMQKKNKVDMRTAAYMVAVARVAEATLTRGIYP